MRILLDTNFVLWAAAGELPKRSLKYFTAKTNELYFSPAAIWEIVLKKQQRADFQVDESVLRAGLIENEYKELPITSAHALLVRDLPPIHKDPFDRILIAQAKAEGLLLLTSDKTLTRYDAPILYVPKKPHSGGKFWLANRPGSA